MIRSGSNGGTDSGNTPEFRTGQITITATWGIAYLIEATLRVGMALWLTPATMVTASPIMAFGVLIALIRWTRSYSRKSLVGRFRMSAEPQANPAGA
jgi:hypothetical protein